jgi:hypothetical protein
VKIDFNTPIREWNAANPGKQPSGLVLSDDAYAYLIANAPDSTTAPAPPEFAFGLRITIDPEATEHVRVIP